MLEAPAELNPHTDQVARLRAGDEKAFLSVVEQYHPTMVRVARNFVGSAAIAEEVVQEAWLGVLSGIGSFEGRSTLKWWILRIVTNCAKSRAQKERRFVPWSALSIDDDPDNYGVNPDRFLDDSHPRWAGGWATLPEL